MKRIYEYNDCGITKEFHVIINNDDIEITQFYGCIIEECLDLPKEVFKKISLLLQKTELLQEAQSIKKEFSTDTEKLDVIEVIITQLKSDKTSENDLGRLEAEICELSAQL